MRRRSIESLYSRARGGATGVLGALQVPSRGWRADTIWRTTGHLLPDLVSSCARVVRKTRLPSREGALAFIGNQLGANVVAWTAGVMSARLVETFFEQRGMRNLWGLAAWGDRTLVSADDYRVIMTLTSYTTGLVMLILMRHLVLRWVSEFRDLRLERCERDQVSDPS
jgi:hypothetical protein